MKITKDVGTGESSTPLLPHRIAAELRPILTVTGAGTALWQGSLILVRRGWTLLGAHLHGWERFGALGFAGYVTVYTAGQAPHIAQFAAPVAAVAWCGAAWWVAPPVPRRKQPAEPVDVQEPDVALTLALDTLSVVVRRVAGDRQGAHLADLLTEPELKGWEQPDLKAAITAFGVPVEEFKLRLAGRQRVRDGVRLRDLPPPAAPSTAPDGDPAPAPDGPPAPAPRPDPAPTTGAG
ncbi:hypothetical protein [Streptomyces sp. AVP053U2]|uniref:hypothetical protein n=1 Tax=Streptomyces sp. AVP053U2 TaxID=1737066 RepID=UPI00083E1029|nr:hypothetical protein [Streptomyces sp. AVP053U2]ODA69532.1 hypothetical protein APS67_006336 [Streptomyces sp. AVP053U2]